MVFVLRCFAECIENVTIIAGVPNGMVRIITNFPSGLQPCLKATYTVCLQMNGAVSEVNKKFISHLTRAKLTPSAAAAVQVSHALPAVRSLVLAAGPVSNMASQQEKAFCVLRFEVSRSVIAVQREFRAPCMVRLF